MSAEGCGAGKRARRSGAQPGLVHACRRVGRIRVIRLHDARHGTATLLTAAGVAPRVVMEILGHSQISITMDVYTHVVQDSQREAMSHMDRLLRKRRLGRD
ncbi:tyrosine-type recombinase/integrase [Streptomyces sp. NPDC006422]|uniref:tyrosine-type recombinase/integrase n=1 Tax=unclassified Streptomyces TaxID=2593676 RepID=UPI00339FC2B3